MRGEFAHAPRQVMVAAITCPGTTISIRIKCWSLTWRDDSSDLRALRRIPEPLDDAIDEEFSLRAPRSGEDGMITPCLTLLKV